MIEVSLPGVFVVVLLVAALVAATGSVWDRYVVYRAARAVRRSRICCRGCGAIYRWGGRESVQDCPECGRPNRHGRDRRLG